MSGTRKTLTFQGVGASPGMVLGRAYTLDRARVRCPTRHLQGGATEIRAEKDRLRAAFAQSSEQIGRVHARLEPQSDQAQILETHLLILKDPMFVGESLRLIEKENINAEWAVRRQVARFKGIFFDMESDYFRERFSDVEFIGERVLRNLLGVSDALDVEGEEIPEGSIAVARDLSPADLATLLRRREIKGIVTDRGAKTSHVAILARAQGMPCVVGADHISDEIHRGDLVAIDGQRGTVTVHPSPEDIEQFQTKLRRRLASEQALHALRQLPAQSQDGVRVRLMGNIDHIAQLPALLAQGAEGVGLFRTELVFLDREALPDEEEHYEIYRAALRALDGRDITFRTLDLGADKMPHSAAAITEREPNPALGLRGLRYCLCHREIFITQLKALLRAAIHGPMRILLPMISSLDELREAKACLEEARSTLTAEGVEFRGDVPLGAMIETPSAAWSADKLARECDFLSIGTNDLVQYTLAFDRQNREVAYLYQPLHVAIVRALQFAVDAGHAAGLPVSMCGEMAGDPLCTLLLLGLGLDELSMVGPQIPIVKRLIRATRADDARDFIDRLKACDGDVERDRFVREEMSRRFGDWLAD